MTWSSKTATKRTDMGLQPRSMQQVTAQVNKYKANQKWEHTFLSSE